MTDKKPRTPKNGKPAESDYSVGFGKPPVHSRFKPGVSGNKAGRPKVSQKPGNIFSDLQGVYTQEISVHDGKSRRKVKAVVVLHETILREALKGDPKAIQLAAKYSNELGVLKIKDQASAAFDLSRLTPEERERAIDAFAIIRKARGLS